MSLGLPFIGFFNDLFIYNGLLLFVISHLVAMERYYNSRSIDIVFKNTYDQGLKYPGFEDDIKEAFKDWKENNISSYPHTLHMAADIGFFVPELKVADIVSHWLKQVYLLSFEYVSENIPGPDWIGVQHGWDLFYIFGIPLVGHRSHPYYSDKDVEVSKKTMDIFSNYVKYGYLTMNGSESSKPYDPKLRNYEKINFENGEIIMKEEQNFREPRIDYWYQRLFANESIFTCSGSSKLSALYTVIAAIVVLLFYQSRS